jgi:putative ABC transport system permease protein
MRRTTAWDRLKAAIVALFAALALLLMWAGLYGTVGRVAAARTREIGIRVALGGHPADVVRLVTRQALRAIAIGLALGLAAAWLGSRLLASQLFGVSPSDPVVYAGVSLLLLAVSVTACYLPARRAAKVDPMVALRCE